MQNTVSPNLYPHRSTDDKKIAIIIFIVIVAAVVGGILWFRQSKKTEQTMIAVVKKKEPTPTEKPKIDKKSVKIEVLNGTGTPGKAGTTVDALKKAGYDPNNIKAGNAKDFATRVTTITVRAGFEDIASDVKDALKAIFDEINIDSSKLDGKSEFDVIVVTGGKKFEVTPTTVVTPTQNPTLSPTGTTTAPIATPSSSLTP